MKAKITRPEHYSYLQHRHQRITQIILPIVVVAVLMLALVLLIWFSTFSDGGDVGRWAAISIMWIAIPIMIAGIIALTMLIGLIYLMARALGALPYYTGVAQDYAQRGRGYVKRGANMLVKPILATEGYIADIKAFFGRMRNP